VEHNIPISEEQNASKPKKENTINESTELTKNSISAFLLKEIKSCRKHAKKAIEAKAI